jgi:hypothetical protein
MFSIYSFYELFKKHQIKREVMVAKRKGERKLWVVFRSNFNSAFCRFKLTGGKVKGFFHETG